jgi:tRNA threonylcarbamoyladenosine modification (KEOPS) complex Cgi121 subunit
MYTKFSQNFNNLPLWQQVIKKDVRFEVKELIDNAGKVTSRQYDAVISGVRHEFKSWREWYSWSDDVIVEQLVKDLANEQIKELSDLQWVFRRSEGITDDILKANIKKALSSDKAIEKLLKELPEDKLIKWFDCDIEEKILSKAQVEEFLEKNYNSIFKTY